MRERWTNGLRRRRFPAGFVNSDYDFEGVQTVKVYSVPTAPLNDYVMSGTSRYGTPDELQNDVCR